MAEMTGFEAGLTGDEQIKLVLSYLASNGGYGKVGDFYPEIEKRMNGATLSNQGKSSLRFFVNKVAKDAGLVEKSPPGWKITAEGRELFLASDVTEEVFDTERSQNSVALSNTAYGAAFEKYVMELMRRLYPSYAWYHLGVQKAQERGLDLIANGLGEGADGGRKIGVQVKFHAPKNRPSDLEWLKFLAGAVARRLDTMIFVTTGALSGEQVRQAQEANVAVIVGRDEVTRLASRCGLERFEHMSRHDEKEVAESSSAWP